MTMTQEDKELLLKDLGARLPYGVVAHHIKSNKNYKVDGCLYNTIKGINLCKIEDDENIEPEPLIYVKTIDKGYQLLPTGTGDVLPYLRPMSNMTDEEKEEFNTFFTYDGIDEYCFLDYIDWLNSHHFDYRGLIEKGLALEAPEGMYKF